MFQIDLKSRKSIYEQVIEKMQELIRLGVIEPDAKLPSVRDLSKSLTVNPNTVQKAYKELERLGYIYTSSGRGSFATPISEIPLDNRRVAVIKEEMRELIRELYLLGFKRSEIQGYFNEMLKEGGQNVKS